MPNPQGGQGQGGQGGQGQGGQGGKGGQVGQGQGQAKPATGAQPIRGNQGGAMPPQKGGGNR